MKCGKYVLGLAVVLLIFLSIVPRSVEVFNKNFIFLLDQGRDYLAVRQIVMDRKVTLIGAEIGSGMAGFQGIFHGPFYFYFLLIPFILFAGDPYGGLLLMFAFGLLTVAMSFFLGRKIFGTFGGVIMALLTAVSPPIIAQSRFIWSPHLSSFFILLAFYFIYQLSGKKPKHFFLAAFFSGFLYNFEFAIVIPMCLALFFYSLVILKFKNLKRYLALAAGYCVAFLPMIMFEVRHGFGAVRGFITYLLFSKSSALFSLSNHSEAFVRNFYDTFPKQTLFPAVLFLTLFVASLLLFIPKEKNDKTKVFGLYLGVLMGTTFFVLSFLRNFVFPYYLIHLNFVYMVLFAYILVSSYTKQDVRIKLIFTLLFVTLIVAAMFDGVHTFRNNYTDYGGMAKIKGKLDAIREIYHDAKQERFGLLVFAPPVYTYPYDYLIWWYGRKEFHYIPHREKTGLFYLLIEKDLAQPWTYKGWLETVVKTGKIVETKELPSGFIIQKRIGNG